MKHFINRKVELEFLENEYSKTESSFIVVYGRRRVGKTTLLNKFIEDKRGIYFLSTQESEAQNRSLFKDAVADFANNELLKAAQLDRWEPIFEELVNLSAEKAQTNKRNNATKPANKNNGNNKLVLIIDEFQYIGKSNNAFISIMQKIWDTLLADKNIMLVLCGSLITLMQSQILNYSSPLYGRRTGQIKLSPISFSHYHEFFPKKNARELLELYSITGGVPKYIEQFSATGNLYDSIESSILKTNSFLYAEPIFVLQQEVSEVGTYFSILKTIAAGNRKLDAISTTLKVPQSGLSRYLKTLMDLEILEREVPVTDENPQKSKRGLYKIKDNFFKFWFQFVYPNLSYIESGHTYVALKKIEHNFIDNQVSFVYEDICQDSLWQLNTKKLWNFDIERCGRWWNAKTEIDIVAYDSGGNIIFGECKYTAKPVGFFVYNALIQKAKAVKWCNDTRKEHFIIFSKSGFEKKLLEFAQNQNNLLLIDGVLS